MTSDRAISKRHSEIPQDALPGLDGPIDDPQSGRGVASTKSPKSIRFARCPDHVVDGSNRNEGLTGVIALTATDHVFRDHTKRVGNTTIPCSGSGKPAPPPPPPTNS